MKIYCDKTYFGFQIVVQTIDIHYCSDVNLSEKLVPNKSFAFFIQLLLWIFQKCHSKNLSVKTIFEKWRFLNIKNKLHICLSKRIYSCSPEINQFAACIDIRLEITNCSTFIRWVVFSIMKKYSSAGPSWDGPRWFATKFQYFPWKGMKSK